MYETFWKVLCHFHIYGQTTSWRNRGVKQMSWVSYLFNDLNDKNVPVTRLAPSTNEEIAEIISASTSSYTTESNEDIFKLDTVFESFHLQAKILIFNRVLLAGILTLWLKRFVVPTLPYEVIVTNVVYPAILLAYGS